MSDVPEHIGRYRIDRVLGRGAMGVIYKARDPEIERDVAIKLVRADLLEGEERADYLARFRREVQAAGRCVHPNIVSVFDFSLHQGNPFLVMEYVRGATLAQILERTRFRPEGAVTVMRQVLAALGCAHGLGVVHRDIKPANVLLLQGGQVKVTDFGISRLGASTLTQGGSVIGTPSYMSPEQCRGENVDARSDLFSVGVVLYELLTGERPFAGRNFTAVMEQVLYHEPPSLHGRVPEGLVALTRRALAKRPEDRFQSAAEMEGALRNALHAGPSTDATVVAPHPAPAPMTIQGGIAGDVLETVQRRLAQHIGPIAKMLVGSAAHKAADFDSLCELLSRNIGSPAEQQRFLQNVRRDVSNARTASRTMSTVASTTRKLDRTEPVLPATEQARIPLSAVEQAQTELSRLIGPFARVLVKRAATSTSSSAEFWTKLAEHIDRPADRAAFMRLKPRE
jgi:serine/threonine protein kinase